tara:strand:+ start:2418 stop:2747 length:330 start_codon:yes stop_codon:yes gene_type:complete
MLRFPIERIKIGVKEIMHTSLRNRTFYKQEEVDAPCLEDGTTYGEWKARVGLVYLRTSGRVPEDILFLVASRNKLEEDFLAKVKEHYGPRSDIYRNLRQNFRDIHKNQF